MREQMLVNGRRLQMVGLVAVLIGAVLWAGMRADAAAGTMTATPSTGLTEGSEIQVQLSGWGDLAQVELLQCNANPQSIEDCAPVQTQNTVTLDFGAGETIFMARVLFSGVDHSVDCHKDQPCSLLAVGDAGDFGAGKFETTLTFSSNGPIEPPPSTTTTTTGSSGTTTTTAGGGTTTTTSAGGGTTTTTAPGGTTTTTKASATTTTTGTTGTTVTTMTRAEATAADPVATKVSSPVAGSIQITEAKVNTTAAPSGLTLLPGEVKVTVPTATVAAPHRLEFRLDGSILGGRDENAIVVLRNGTAVPNCTGAPQANPDPCVTSRSKSGDDVVLTVLSSQGSVWNFAYGATTATTAGAGGTTTTTLRAAAAPVSTLPATGVGTVMMWLFAAGLGLAGAGSLMRRQATRA